MTTTTESAGRRLSVVTIDQILSGASNILVALLAAHLLGTAAFGLFGLVLIIYAAGQGVVRSLVCEPVIVHPDDARNRPGAAISAALIVGSMMGVLIAGGGAALHVAGFDLGPELLVLALTLPGLVLHDLGRYLGFATQQPMRSLALDLLWLLLIVVAATALVVTDSESLLSLIIAWVGTGALASLLVLVQHRPRLGGGWAWLKERWPFSWRYLLSFSATQGAVLVFSVVVAAVAGAVALGAVRGILLLLRPFITFQTAVVAASVAEIANDATPRDRIPYVLRTSAIALTMAFINIAILLLLPDAGGELLLADTWHATEVLVPPACLQIICLALVIGPRSYINGNRDIKTTVRNDVLGTALLFTVGIIGVILDSGESALGAYWGVAIGQGAAAVLWWASLRHTRTPE